MLFVPHGNEANINQTSLEQVIERTLLMISCFTNITSWPVVSVFIKRTSYLVQIRRGSDSSLISKHTFASCICSECVYIFKYNINGQNFKRGQHLYNHQNEVDTLIWAEHLWKPNPGWGVLSTLENLILSLQKMMFPHCESWNMGTK